VSFTEARRRRVFLITLLAMVGVFVVSQLMKAIDEQDAIRQTIKFCLFATGLIITVTAIILACTNLPKEIENRVVYTVVTKPVTRLEIVLGKILGFARVSAVMLIIMGIFTFAYLHIRAWQFKSAINERLAPGSALDDATRTTLQHYQQAGLLTAKSLRQSSDVQIFSRVPLLNDSRRYMPGNGAGDFIVPFAVNKEDLIPPGAPQPIPGQAGLLIALSIGYERDPTYVPPKREDTNVIPPTVAAPTSKPSTAALRPPEVIAQILDENANTLIASRQINNGQNIPLPDASGQKPVFIAIPAEACAELLKKDHLEFYVHVIGASQGVEYFVDIKHDPPPVVVLVPPAAESQQPREIIPMADAAGNPSPPRFRGRSGTSGMQLPGGNSGVVPVADYRFTNAPPDHVPADGKVPFELKTGIERGDVEEEGAVDVLTTVEFTAVNRATGKSSLPTRIAIESNRQAYFTLPAEFVRDGDFDLLVRCISPGHFVGIGGDTVAMVAGTESFNFNLIKSLLIMWLMSILVISVAIFCSTFLSWPIAIVLTLVILLGRWGVEQLGDATQPGIGATVVNDIFGANIDPSKAKVVSTSVEKLAAGLNALAAVLPDISRFAATEDIERGLTVPAARLTESMKVLLTYGLATLTLAYVCLRLKEVAP
jgi:hypothetical protein